MQYVQIDTLTAQYEDLARAGMGAGTPLAAGGGSRTIWP